MLQGAPLLSGEHGRVDLLGVLGLAQDDAGAGTAQSLVGGGGDHVGAVGERVGVKAGGDKSREVSHVDHQQRPNLVGDLAEAGEVELAGIGRPAGKQELGATLARYPCALVHVDDAALAVDLVGGDVIQTTRNVDFHTVGEVAAVGEGETHDRVARLQKGVVDGGVGLGTGGGLDV